MRRCTTPMISSYAQAGSQHRWVVSLGCDIVAHPFASSITGRVWELSGSQEL